MAKVVITGMGIISPLSHEVEGTWNAIQREEIGIGEISLFETTDFKVKHAFEVKQYTCPILRPNQERRYTRFLKFALGASAEAIAQSGIEISEGLALKTGCIIGSGIGGAELIESSSITAVGKAKRVSPFFVPYSITNMASGLVSQEFGLKGINLSISTACASGAHSIGYAYQLIKSGALTAAIAGGSEGCINRVTVAGFQNMTALNTNSDPQKASIPFDKNRGGFAIGEGAGILFLEDEEHAKARGATILAEVVGYGASSDAYHISASAPKGEGAQRSMKDALKDAGIGIEEIDYISAHGTATPLNDLNEAQAIHAVFKQSKPFVSSSKNATGHGIGAAGAMELIFCVKTMMRDRAPSNFSSKDLDPELSGLINLTDQKQSYDYCLSNSFGFGGHNASLIVKKYKKV